MFLASASFFVTFGATRLLVHSYRTSPEPLQLWISGIHVHHYVWGILLLLLVGYLWLIQVGTGTKQDAHKLGRLTALLYGAGSALTLDEFALWLHLEDVYWERTGRASIDAILLFGALVSAGLWGGPFWRAVLRRSARVLRKRLPAIVTAGDPLPPGATPGVEPLLALAPVDPPAGASPAFATVED